MTTMKNTRLVTAATALIALASVSFLPQIPAANAQATATGVAKQGKMREKHPEIMRALRNLERAQDNLQKAAHDLAGHREKALDLTQQAITECKAALSSDK